MITPMSLLWWRMCQHNADKCICKILPRVCMWIRERCLFGRNAILSHNTLQHLQPILTSQTHLFSSMNWCQNSMATTLPVALGLLTRKRQDRSTTCTHTHTHWWLTTTVSKQGSFTRGINVETLPFRDKRDLLWKWFQREHCLNKIVVLKRQSWRLYLTMSLRIRQVLKDHIHHHLELADIQSYNVHTHSINVCLYVCGTLHLASQTPFSVL